MRISKLFLPTHNLTAKDTNSNTNETKNHTLPSYDLMIKAGLIRKLSPGIYTWLPLGVKVLDKIIKVIDDVMSAYDAQKIIMPCIQPATLWQESGRYDAYGKEMLRITDRHDHAMLFGPTHEEVVSDLFRNNVYSYKNYPRFLYQITTKFRDEIRPRFGVMRGREFIMKDCYSFDLTHEMSVDSYYQMYQAYLDIFKALGIHTLVAAAENGAIGGDMSHEFHILSKNGESSLYFDPQLLDQDMSMKMRQNLYCATDEKHPLQSSENEKLLHHKSIEVGHIFNFGLKYSQSMNITIQNEKQERSFLYMGSYGIGVSRLVAAAIERYSLICEQGEYKEYDCGYDERGIIWPRKIAPFDISIINLDIKNSLLTEKAENLFKILSKEYDVLLDDSPNSAGSKFATNDLIGIPVQLIISERNLANNMVGVKLRKSLGQEILVSFDQIQNYLRQELNLTVAV